MANGIKVARGCPPPYGGTPTKSAPATAVKVKTLIQALDEIQKWAGSVKSVLASLPPDTTIKVKKAAKATKK